MKIKLHFHLCALILLGGLASQFPACAGSPPVVTNVAAAQRGLPSKLVDISYTVSDPDSTSVNVFFLVSSNSGTSWTVPAHTASGAYGTNVAVTATPTTKFIVWDAGTDWDGHYTTKCRVRVVVNDNDMVMIPTGSYTRGNLVNGFPDTDITDAPAYPVYVSAFLMDSKLVTGGKWNLVKGGYADSHGYTFDYMGSFKSANHPVYSVSWFDAVKWCNARSQMEGLVPVYYTNAACTALYTNGQVAPFVKAGANGYRLPTEAEWEKAARGGSSGKRFPWGDTITHSQANYYSDPYASYTYDTSPTRGYHPTYNDGVPPYTSPVGSFAGNGYGLYDMAGNLYELCWDWYGSYSTGQTDPQGPLLGTNRVLRGGSWTHSAYGARCAYRTAGFDGFDVGFRCVRGF